MKLSDPYNTMTKDDKKGIVYCIIATVMLMSVLVFG